MRYRFIDAEKATYPVVRMCKVLRVSPSGYYAYKSRAPSTREQEDEVLAQQVATRFTQSRGTYGTRRLRQDLKSVGQSVGRSRIRRLMDEQGLKVCGKGPKRVKTTDSRHGLAVANNHLAQVFTAPHPGAVWVTDITYLPTAQGWLYLAAIVDLFSRRVVGYAMDDRMDTTLCEKALDMALTQSRPCPGLVHHSDRGSQYASHRYQQRLRHHGITCSMSRKGNCYDNAVAESFFATLKRELVDRQRWPTHGHLKLAVFEYVEVFYNRHRRHSTLGYLSPVDFENSYYQNLGLAA